MKISQKLPPGIQQELKACRKAWRKAAPEKARQFHGIHRLLPPFEAWERLRQDSVLLPHAPPLLHPWRPHCADEEPGREEGIQPVGPQDIVVPDHALNSLFQQILHRAAARSPQAPRMFHAEPSLQGYPWHKAMGSLERIEVQAWIQGEIHRFPPRPEDPHDEPDAPPVPWERAHAPLPPRMDRIDIQLVLKGPVGPRTSLTLNTDLAFAWDAQSIANAVPVVTQGISMKAQELAEILKKALFVPANPDYETRDAMTSKRLRFDDAALHAAWRTLEGDQAAFRNVSDRIIRREMQWAIPPGQQIIHEGDTP